MRQRAAFTMIELIFVIVILGILTAIALPKFVGVSEDSHIAICESAIGTMNRTIGLNLWSKSIAEGNAGLITLDAAAMVKNLPDYNSTDCGVLLGLTEGAAAAGDGIYGSPRFINDGNMTTAPKWAWVRK
ncbi:MAG: type II secretion system protein [Sulfuricurvum sp.]|nr:type II secretion system protein [Sulfuricurvum sp.]